MPTGCKYCGELLPKLLQSFGYCNDTCAGAGKIASAADKRKRKCNRCEKKIKGGIYCPKCKAEMDAMAKGTPASRSKPLNFVAAECSAGQSSGRERKSMCYGNAENANGLWDNLIRAIEE